MHWKHHNFLNYPNSYVRFIVYVYLSYSKILPVWLIKNNVNRNNFKKITSSIENTIKTKHVIYTGSNNYITKLTSNYLGGLLWYVVVKPVIMESAHMGSSPTVEDQASSGMMVGGLNGTGSSLSLHGGAFLSLASGFFLARSSKYFIRISCWFSQWAPLRGPPHASSWPRSRL